jgi:hypothetical protein
LQDDDDDDDDDDNDAESVTSSIPDGDSGANDQAGASGTALAAAEEKREEGMEFDGEYTYETKEEEGDEDEDEDEEDEDESAEFDPVAAVLAQLGFEEYLPAFQREKILLEQLPELDDADLKELGVHLGPRKRMLRVFKQVYVGDNTAGAAPGGAKAAPAARAPTVAPAPQEPSPLGKSECHSLELSVLLYWIYLCFLQPPESAN